MFCEDLTQEEVYEAYLLYSCLHGLRMDEESVREQVSDYYERSQPDPRIDDALLAYLEDRILAPPAVVLDRWGSSRFYELYETDPGMFHRRTCESWFLNGCQLPAANEVSELEFPEILHFWTEIYLEAGRQEIVTECLREGTRVRMLIQQAGAYAVHRQHGELGRLPENLYRQLNSAGMTDRKFLCLVDQNPVYERDGKKYCSLLVTTGEQDVPLEAMVEYAANAFTIPRNKC